MFIGTQYFRPPHPAREDWERDLQNMVDTGLSLVRIWIYWSQVNPCPGQWLWDDVDAFIEAAQRYGLRVLAQLMPDAMPYWFKDQHPEALFRNGNGDIVQVSAGGAMAVGGIPGPNYDHPIALEAGGEFITRTVERYAEHPALYAWDIWNELWPWVISPNAVLHNEATVAKWQQWLRTRYGDINALNHHWMRSYASFAEVEWPVNGIYADLGTRYLFDQERVAEWMRWRIALVRQHNPAHKLVTAHTGGIGPVAALNDPWGGDLTDPWLFSNLLDVWGTSCYLYDFYQWSFLLDSTRSAAQGHPYWIFEMNGGRGHYRPPGAGFYSNYLRSAEEIRSQVLLGFSHGAEGGVFWQWRPESFGPESPGWGLTTAAGKLTERTEALRGLTAMLRTHSKLFEQLQFPKPQVGVIWEPRSYQAERLAGWKPDFGYLGGFELFGYHKALTALGFAVEYLNARTLVERNVPQHLKVIFHPYPVADRTGLAANLTSWVESGGVLVVGPGVGMFDQQLKGSAQIPPAGWQELLGVSQHEMYYPDSPTLRLLPGTQSGTVQQLAGYHLIESYQLEGAETLGVWGSQVALTSHRVGKGYAIAVGAFLGQPVALQNIWQLTSWLATLCAAAGVSQPVRVTGSHVFSRLAASGDTHLLFVHNAGSEPTTAWITVEPGVGERQVKNLVAGEAIASVAPGHALCITLAAKDSTVYALDT